MAALNEKQIDFLCSNWQVPLRIIINMGISIVHASTNWWLFSEKLELNALNVEFLLKCFRSRDFGDVYLDALCGNKEKVRSTLLCQRLDPQSMHTCQTFLKLVFSTRCSVCFQLSVRLSLPPKKSKPILKIRHRKSPEDPLHSHFRSSL